MSKWMLSFILVVFNLSAQNGYKEPTDVEFLSRKTITQKLNKLRESRQTLPHKVDHSKSMYMRPAFNQVGGSCGSASRISYMFAYELNNYRDISGSDSVNIYPSHFTWLLTGQNSGKWQMAVFNGVPNVLTYGGPLYSYELGGNVGWPTDADNQDYGWMQGYDKWRSAIDNRLEKTEDIQFKTMDDLEYVKWWIYNHQGDDSFNEGGVCGGGVASSGWVTKQIPAGQYGEGEWIITQFGPTVDHGVTWSGYDDSIAFDLNNSGSIEDDERGAIIMLNSWGAGWKNDGCIYIPYKLLFDSNRSSEHYFIRKNYRPVDVFRVLMDYNQRSNIKISIGVSSDSTATLPEKTVAAEHFKYAGNGEVPMLGKWSDGTLHTEAMEFALDLTDLTSLGFDTRKAFTYFLIIETSDDNGGNGTVQELDVIRYNYTDNSTYDSSIVGSINHESVAINGVSNKIIIPVKVSGNGDNIPQHIYIPQERLSVYSVSTENSTGQSSNVLDGDESTIWHSRWSTGKDPFPHDITIEIDSAYNVNGLEYLPRQDGSSNGRIGEYEIYISSIAGDLGTLVDSGTWENNSNVKYGFFTATPGTFVTLRSKTDASGNGHTCMAELNLLGLPTDVTSAALSKKKNLHENLSLIQKNNFLQINGISNNSKFSICNVLGREVNNVIIEKSKDRVLIDTQELASGIYFVNIKSGSLIKSLKFINR